MNMYLVEYPEALPNCPDCGLHRCRSVASQPLRKHRKAIEPNGYRKHQAEDRWQFIKNQLPLNPDAHFTCLDVGSNFGFFSLKTAVHYPQSRVFSVEGSFGSGNENRAYTTRKSTKGSAGVTYHKEQRTRHRATNNVICEGLFTVATIDRLLEANIRFDYQFSLAVFHWMHDLSKVLRYPPLSILGNHLRVAETTFLELPAMDQEGALRGYYDGFDSIPEVLRAAAKAVSITIDIKHLGACEWHGIRDTFRVDVIRDSRPLKQESTCDTILQGLGVAVDRYKPFISHQISIKQVSDAWTASRSKLVKEGELITATIAEVLQIGSVWICDEEWLERIKTDIWQLKLLDFKDGWIPEYPLSIAIGPNGFVTVADGNHRLAFLVYHELFHDISHVPVRFFYGEENSPISPFHPNTFYDSSLLHLCYPRGTCGVCPACVAPNPELHRKVEKFLREYNKNNPPLI